MTGPDPAQYGWWLASRASGVVALALITASVAIGLTMAGKVMRRPGIGRKLKTLHEHTALAGLVAIAIHGITLLGDRWLHPGVTGILVPFQMGYRPVFTGLGILAGYLAAALGLTLLRPPAHRPAAVAEGPPRDRRRLRPRARPRARRGDRCRSGVAARLHARDRRADRAAVRAPAAAAAAPQARGRAGGAAMSGGLRHRRRWPCGPALHSGPAPRGYTGRLTLVGAEPRLPYDRPPLSKELLAGAFDPAQFGPSSRVLVRRARRRARARPGGGCAAASASTRSCSTTASTLRYDRLLVATGSQPRRLELLDGADNVHVLRTCDDALALREALLPGARLAVVGAGFVGQEVAATARRLGVAVTLVDPAPLPLLPVLGAPLGRWLARMHAEEGVDVRLSARGRARARQRPRRGARARGRRAGPGGRGARRRRRGPGDRLARRQRACSSASAAVAGATAVPDVFAAGDAAGGHHWDAAARQGVAAAHGMLGLRRLPPPPPSFWSDQYGVRLQLVGAPGGHDRVDVDGDPASRDFHAVFRRDGRPVAGLAVGRPHELPRLRRLIAQPEAEVIP